MRLLIAIGGSAHSAPALQMSVQLAYLSAEKPTILTVIRAEEERPRAEKGLAEARALFQAEGIEARTIIRKGQVDLEILHEVLDGGYDLLVLGERQMHRLITRLRGTVSVRLARQAPCSVLIVKGPVRPCRRVLLCESATAEPPLSERFVSGRLGQLLADAIELTVLHVMSQIPAAVQVDPSQLEADAETLIRLRAPEGEWLRQAVERLRPRCRQVRAVVRHGLVVDEILTEARAGDYDLVVIGAHREHGWQRFLLDDIAHEIITQIDRSILVVP